MIRSGPVLPVIIFGISILLISCGSDNKIPPSMSREGNIEELLAIAGESSSDPAMRYAALEPVIAQARFAGEADWLSALLGFILESEQGRVVSNSAVDVISDCGWQHLFDELSKDAEKEPDMLDLLSEERGIKTPNMMEYLDQTPNDSPKRQ